MRPESNSQRPDHSALASAGASLRVNGGPPAPGGSWLPQARVEGRYVFLDPALWRGWDARPPEAEPEAAPLLSHLRAALAGIGPFYFHLGGAGDALLLLATFLDAEPGATVLSLPNAVAAGRAFFEAFPSLAQVWFLPPCAHEGLRRALRRTVPCLPECRGTGVTPRGDYEEEWTPRLDLFGDYGLAPHPRWVERFRGESHPRRVVLAPQGSPYGQGFGGHNAVPPRAWAKLVSALVQQGLQPVILGTPEERAVYPCLAGCEDRRSHSFAEQMRVIASSRLLVGADSWAKTFAALAGVPAIVFQPPQPRAWTGAVHPSKFVFLDPWEEITVVRDLAEALRALAWALGRGRPDTAEPVSVPGSSASQAHGPMRPRGLRRALSSQPTLRVLFEASEFARYPREGLPPETCAAAAITAAVLRSTDACELRFALWERVEQWSQVESVLAERFGAPGADLLQPSCWAWVHRRWSQIKCRARQRGQATPGERLALEALRLLRRWRRRHPVSSAQTALAEAEVLLLPYSANLPPRDSAELPPVLQMANGPGPARASGLFGRQNGWKHTASPAPPRLRFVVPWNQMRDRLLAEVPGLTPDHVRVVPPALSPLFPTDVSEARTIAALARQGLTPQSYFLTRWDGPPGQALQRLLVDFARWRIGPPMGDARLALVASETRELRWWMSEGLPDPALAAGIRLLEMVGEADLPPLYAGARAFIYANAREGLGLPAIEALHCGTPVLAPRAGYLPELVGEAGMLWDPADSAAFGQVLRAYSGQAGVREVWSRKAQAQAQRFTAARHRDALLAVLREVIEAD